MHSHKMLRGRGEGAWKPAIMLACSLIIWLRTVSSCAHQPCQRLICARRGWGQGEKTEWNWWGDGGRHLGANHLGAVRDDPDPVVPLDRATVIPLFRLWAHVGAPARARARARQVLPLPQNQRFRRTSGAGRAFLRLRRRHATRSRRFIWRGNKREGLHASHPLDRRDLAQMERLLLPGRRLGHRLHLPAHLGRRGADAILCLGLCRCDGAACALSRWAGGFLGTGEHCW